MNATFELETMWQRPFSAVDCLLASWIISNYHVVTNFIKYYWLIIAIGESRYSNHASLLTCQSETSLRNFCCSLDTDLFLCLLIGFDQICYD